MKRYKSQDANRGRGLPVFGARVALGIVLLLLSLTAASLLALATTVPAEGNLDPIPAKFGFRPAQVASPGAGNAFTGSIAATAFLPVLVNGYPPSYPWTGEIVATYPNCTLTRLFGFVLNQYDEAVGDVWIHYWADNYDGDWDKSSWVAAGDHNWDGTLDNRPRDVLWYACVVPEKKSWDCQSNIVEAPTSDNCRTGIQVYRIDFRQN